MDGGLTALSLAPPPYSIVAFLISAGISDKFTTSTAVDAGLTTAGLLKGFKGKFFSGLGAVKSGISAYQEYQELKDFTNVHVTVKKGSLYEGHIYQLNPNKAIEKVSSINRFEQGTPARFKAYEMNYVPPDVWLQYSNEKFYFND